MHSTFDICRPIKQVPLEPYTKRKQHREVGVLSRTQSCAQGGVSLRAVLVLPLHPPTERRASVGNAQQQDLVDLATKTFYKNSIKEPCSCFLAQG